MSPFIATLPRFFLLLIVLKLCGFTSNVNAASQPADWNQAVESAAANHPVFWLEGGAEENLGSEIPGRLNVRGAKLVPADGYWEGKSGFVTDPATAPSSSLLVNSADTRIACSPEGTVVLLFQTPSDFLSHEAGKPAKALLFSRVTRDMSRSFEIAIVDSFLRLLISDEAGKSRQKPICKLEPSQWHWLAVRWKGEGDSTVMDWQLLAPPDPGHIDQGSLITSAVGDASGIITIGGSYQKETPPVPFSQIIVWDSFISNEALEKLVRLLKK